MFQAAPAPAPAPHFVMDGPSAVGADGGSGAALWGHEIIFPWGITAVHWVVKCIHRSSAEWAGVRVRVLVAV